MQLRTFYNSWEIIADEHRERMLEKFFTELSNNISKYEDFIQSVLELATEYEADDYFGTEGFDL